MLAGAFAVSVWLSALRAGAPAPRSWRAAASTTDPSPAEVLSRRASAGAARLGTELWTNGQAVDLEWSESPLGPDAEAERRAAGLLARHDRVERRRLGRGWHLGARADDGCFVSVLVLPGPVGGSHVVTGRGAGPLRPGAEAQRLGLPLLPERLAVFSQAATDGAVERVTVQHLTARTPAAVAAWYRDRLAALGWTPRRLAPSEAGVAHFRRGAEEVWVGVQATDAGTGVLLIRERPR